jgi:hypothetical protein
MTDEQTVYIAKILERIADELSNIAVVLNDNADLCDILGNRTHISAKNPQKPTRKRGDTHNTKKRKSPASHPCVPYKGGGSKDGRNRRKHLAGVHERP